MGMFGVQHCTAQG